MSSDDKPINYQVILDNLGDGFCCIEVLLDERGQCYDFQILEVNQTYEQQTGLKNAVGKTALELVPGLEPYWFERYGQVASTGESVQFESYTGAMNRWFEVNACRVGVKAVIRWR
jgi:PAS domain-containing protein